MLKSTFIFLLSPILLMSQTFIRSSDEKAFRSVTLSRNGKNTIIDNSNFKNFEFDQNDRILYNDKLLDFSVSNDTLFFFDKVKEIEKVQLDYENLNNKREKTFKSEKKNASSEIFANNRIATFIKIDTKKKTFVKSVIFFPELLFFSHDIKGIIDIQVLPSVNGFPDDGNPILSFQREISEAVRKKWEIVLPRIIKYPDEGFFVTFYYQPKNMKKTAVLKLNNESQMFMYYPQDHQWKITNVGCFLYKVKVLQ